MPVEIVDFEASRGDIDGLWAITMKQVTDERGTIRELFRRSAFESVGIDVGCFDQVNITESVRGAVRGMHAENMVKLVTVAAGRAAGAYVDLRADSPTRGVVEIIELRPGVQVFVPAGVANGFQALTDGCQFAYCFDAEWRPDMAGRSCSPLDLGPGCDWPLPIDPDDPSQISVKDRDAPPLSHLLAELGAGS